MIKRLILDILFFAFGLFTFWILAEVLTDIPEAVPEIIQEEITDHTKLYIINGKCLEAWQVLWGEHYFRYDGSIRSGYYE